MQSINTYTYYFKLAKNFSKIVFSKYNFFDFQLFNSRILLIFDIFNEKLIQNPKINVFRLKTYFKNWIFYFFKITVQRTTQFWPHRPTLCGRVNEDALSCRLLPSTSIGLLQCDQIIE